MVDGLAPPRARCLLLLAPLCLSTEDSRDVVPRIAPTHDRGRAGCGDDWRDERNRCQRLARMARPLARRPLDREEPAVEMVADRATTSRGACPSAAGRRPSCSAIASTCCPPSAISANTQERLVALDAETGKLVWEHRFSIYLSDVPQHRAGWASPAVDPGDRQRLRVHRRRAVDRALARRQGAVGPLAALKTTAP